MLYLSEQNYNATQLPLIFTLQVNLIQQEPQTTWSICSNTTRTYPTEVYILASKHSILLHMNLDYTHISLPSKVTFLLQEPSASHKVEECMPTRTSLHSISCTVVGWKTSFNFHADRAQSASNLLLNPYQNPNNQYGSS